jgi:hypothetical protein
MLSARPYIDCRAAVPIGEKVFGEYTVDSDRGLKDIRDCMGERAGPLESTLARALRGREAIPPGDGLERTPEPLLATECRDVLLPAAPVPASAARLAKEPLSVASGLLRSPTPPERDPGRATTPAVVGSSDVKLKFAWPPSPGA